MSHVKLCVIVIGILLASVSGQLSGSLSGQNLNLNLAKSIGNEKANLGGGLFANGNINSHSPPTTGGFLEANRNGHGASLLYSKTPDFGSTFQQNAHVNLLNKDNHNLNANAFHSRTHLDNGFKFNRLGGSLDYNHANGHGASVGVSRIPQLQMNTLDLNGKANLWRSPNRLSTLDLNGGISKNFGGQVNKNIGLSLTRHF